MGLADFVVGWALGAKAGTSGFDQVLAAARNVLDSKEFKDLTEAARSHAAHTLHQLGDLVSLDGERSEAGADVLDMVRHLTRQTKATS